MEVELKRREKIEERIESEDILFSIHVHMIKRKKENHLFFPIGKQKMWG